MGRKDVETTKADIMHKPTPAHEKVRGRSCRWASISFAKQRCYAATNSRLLTGMTMAAQFLWNLGSGYRSEVAANTPGGACQGAKVAAVNSHGC